MSNSPRRIEMNLQNEIKKRINQSQLSKNDLQFYQRKVRRLQNQHSILQDQLSKIKVKLRRAQDYEYKYELIFKQNTDLKNDLDSKNNEINDLRAINEQLKINLEEKANKDQDYSVERESLIQQIGKWKDKYDLFMEKSRRDLQDQRIRSQQVIKREQQKIKRDYAQRQEDYQFQIRQLKKVIEQKQTVEDIISGRVEKIRTEKDAQINRLKGILQHKSQSYDQYMKEKDEQLERMKEKFQKMINFDIQNLKNNQEDQEQIFSIQLNGLREMIGLKNDEIEKLLLQIKRQAKQHQSNRKDLQKEISLLKQKLYTVQKEAESELFNLKERLITIHKQDIITIQDRHQKILDSLKDQLQDSKRYIKEIQRIKENEKLQFERMKNEFHDRLKEKDRRIAQLGQNLRQRGQLNVTQLKSLHESFHKITSQREIMASQYQSNITFLNQQITKLATTNQIKSTQIKKLHEQIHELKLSYQDHIQQIQSKMRRQRKEHEQQRQQQRSQREKMKQTIQDMERDMKNKQRRMERERQKLERQKNKIQYMLQEAERDIQRLNRYIKQLDENLKNQFKKTQLSTLDKDSLRRQILSELQKQKVQLQALKMMEIDQIRKRYQIEQARLTTLNEQLQTQLLNKTIAFDKLESQFKKLDYKHRNADKLQRDKIKQYETKMMTLNQEINITQNLYKTFLEMKARAQQ